MKHAKTLSLFGAMLAGVLLLSSCGPAPALTNGEDTWKLTSVTFLESVETPNGGALTPIDSSFKIIRAEFECVEGKSLVGLVMGQDDAGISSVFLTNGFSDVYITADDGEEYAVYVIDSCAITGSVPADGSGFRLHFMDLEPVPLDLDS